MSVYYPVGVGAHDDPLQTVGLQGFFIPIRDAEASFPTK